MVFVATKLAFDKSVWDQCRRARAARHRSGG